MLNGPVSRSLFSFLLVGASGFLVDAGILLAAMALGTGPYAGRILAICIAAIVTWRLNRSHTFGASGLSQRQEGMRYFSGVALGSALNFALYAGLIAAGFHPLAALFAASLLVMGFSYTFFRIVVFGGPRNRFN